MSASSKYMLSDDLRILYDQIIKDLPGYQISVERSPLDEDEDDSDPEEKKSDDKKGVSVKSKRIKKVGRQ